MLWKPAFCSITGKVRLAFFMKSGIITLTDDGLLDFVGQMANTTFGGKRLDGR